MALLRILFPLILLSSIFYVQSTKQTLGFRCTKSTTCNSLIDYKVPNTATTLTAINHLFDIKHLHSLLEANNFPVDTPQDTIINAAQILKIPFPCLCRNGTGISNRHPIYTFVPNDSLLHIAADVFSGLVTFQQIKDVNNIPDSNMISKGQTLWIPLPCSCDDVDGKVALHYGHLVAAGSTVGGIAKKFNTTDPETLLELNGMKDSSELLVGSILDVPLQETETETETSTTAPKYVKNGCKDMCGTVKIPYPFGIGANCSVNKWYTVDCNSSKPYLSSLHHLQVLGVDIESQTVNINTPIVLSGCNWINSVDLGRSPFLFSKSQNKFVFEGCGNASMMDHGSSLTGCSTTCHNDDRGNDTKCLGISCCQTTIPRHLKSYSMNLTGFNCGSALIMDKDSYLEGRAFAGENNPNVPVSLLWTLLDSDYKNASCCDYSSRVQVDLGNGFYLGNGLSSVDSFKCIFKEYGRFEGNPYLRDGCQYKEECVKCRDRGGYCDYEIGKKFTCHFSSIRYYDHASKSRDGVILGVSMSIGVFFLVATSYVLYKVIKKTKERRRKKKFFKRNGGLLLKQQEEADPLLVDKAVIFTSRELEKATDNFSDNRILGRGGHGTVYKGMLPDGRIVAVKKSKIIDESQLEEFINEVVILSQVNHRNVVKLLGCCLETDVPLLVSEYIPNGTLHDRLHNETSEFPISLHMRLQISTQVAGALAYLHSATAIPIYHRDIKTTNILLDEKYRAKVSDFGTSRFVSIDQTHLTTLVKGTFGYLDPEYFQSSQFTEKSDVYSFGVVLVELLTRERPISLTRFGENRSLVTHFLLAMEEGRVMSILDETVINEGTRDELLALANLAARCLSLIGKYRPTMKEVSTDLETMLTFHVHSQDQTNIIPMIYGEDLSMIRSQDQTNIIPMIYEEELSMITNSESSSTFLSFKDTIN